MERHQALLRCVAPLILAACLPLLAGCGGSSSAATTGSSSSTTTSGSDPSAATGSTGTPLSSSQLIARADAICKAVNTRLAAKGSQGITPREVVYITTLHESIERNGVKELSKLKPPPSLSEVWAALIAARTKLADELGSLVKVARKGGNAGEIMTLGHAKAQQRAALLAAAKQGGFKDCQQVG